MKKNIIACMFVSFCILSLTGCSARRSAGTFWEDTKTAGRHMSRGLRSLGGKQGDSKMIQHPSDFKGPQEEEYIPLDDQADTALTAKEVSYPLSRVSPGEKGSVLPGIEGFVEPTGHESSLFHSVHFDTDKHQIIGADNERIISNIAKYLKDHPRVYLFIEGHCDERGQALYNMALGSRRANMVRNKLIQEGVDLDRIFTISYGYEKPLIVGHEPEAWAQNRRAQFKLFVAK